MGDTRTKTQRKRTIEQIRHSLTCSVPEAAHYLGVSVIKVRELIRTGEIRGFLNGPRWVIVTQSLSEWVDRKAS